MARLVQVQRSTISLANTRATSFETVCEAAKIFALDALVEVLRCRQRFAPELDEVEISVRTFEHTDATLVSDVSASSFATCLGPIGGEFQDFGKEGLIRVFVTFGLADPE